MLIEIDAEIGIVPELREQIQMILDEIEYFKNEEYLPEHKWEDLKYDLALLPALRTVLKYYSIPSQWSEVDDMQIHCDFRIDDYPELVYDFDLTSFCADFYPK